MKRLVPLLLLGVAVGVMTAAFVRRGCCDAHLAHAADCGDTCYWFRVEFGLDDKTIAAVMQAQSEFEPECAEHCRVVNKARVALEKLTSGTSAAETETARAAVADAEKFCRDARFAHARRLASLMPPDAGRRYLEIVLPRLAGHDHASVPDAAGRR